MKNLVFDSTEYLMFPINSYIILTIIVVAIFIYYKKLRNHIASCLENNGDRLTKNRCLFIKFFAPVFLILVFLISLFSTYYNTNQYYILKDVINNKSYSIEEGEVEKFNPMPYSGHQKESFELNGIFFSYSDYMGDEQYFKQTKSHKGPIKENGQKIKIYYIPQPDTKEVCIPCVSRCIEFYTAGNQIIKMWIGKSSKE